MRLTIFFAVFVVLSACPSTPGEQGPMGAPGAKGDPGQPGQPGAKGDKGDKGDQGDPGAPGAPGMQGAEGPAGPQGLQGPAGQVVVVDGGVVTGPPGSSVIVTAITPGATCQFGGVRVTQLSDAGISNVCNGAPGATGPAGPQGTSVTASALAVMSPQCPTGGVLVQLADGGAFPVCNGATGAAGATGATGAMGPMGAQGPAGIQGPAGAQGVQGAQGAQGPAGPMGAQGPQGPTGPVGPAGSVLYLDGGAVLVAGDIADFAGFTVATYTGDLGGYPGANAKCAAEFPGSALCTRSDYDLANTTAAPPASGAWIDYPRDTNGMRAATYCYATLSEPWTYSGAFTGGSGQQGGFVTPTGDHVLGACNLVKPLACCFVPPRAVFRGFTAATFTGNLGGYPGANAKCAAEFPGSFLCTRADYDLANTTSAPPASGAWIDYPRDANGMRAATYCYATLSEPWTYSGAFTGGSGQQGGFVTPTGDHVLGACNLLKPLSCCSRR